nr:hypothetical protein [Tanacetum cinerariifolium]
MTENARVKGQHPLRGQRAEPLARIPLLEVIIISYDDASNDYDTFDIEDIVIMGDTDDDDIDIKSDDDIDRSSDEYKTFHDCDIKWKRPYKLTEGIGPQTASTPRVSSLSRVKGKGKLKVPTKRKRTIQKVKEVKHKFNKLKRRSCVRGLRALPARVEEVFVKKPKSEVKVINYILGLRAPNAPGLGALSARVEEVAIKKPRSEVKVTNCILGLRAPNASNVECSSEKIRKC